MANALNGFTFKRKSKRTLYREIHKSVQKTFELANIESKLNQVQTQNLLGKNEPQKSDNNCYQELNEFCDDIEFADNDLLDTTFLTNNDDDKVLTNCVSDRTTELLNKVDKDVAEIPIVEQVPIVAKESDPTIVLKNWSIKNGITHSALGELLTWLRSNPLNISNVPKDPRTLLSTPRSVTVQRIGSGQFYYFGLKQSLSKLFLKLSVLPDAIDLDFNIDGLPIHKSTNEAFWPILCKVLNLENTIFPVAIYCGSAKPPLSEYLDSFTKELKIIKDTGLTFKEKCVLVKIRSFCLDTPARSFIKNVKGHNAYHGCDKCYVLGKHVSRRMVFLDLKAKRRTDEEFQNQSDTEHHKGISPLTALNIGLVSVFPIDFMHCVCLGVVRKLLFIFRDRCRLYGINRTKIALINEKINSLKTFWPRDFNRKLRPLTEIEKWKATEFLNFLLYWGPVVLRDALPKQLFCNFLLLKYAMNILLSKELNEIYNNYANQLLLLFVKHAISIYGEEFCTYNTHSLIHLADDAKYYGSLRDINCFPFENYLKTLKDLLRKPNLPLKQVISRLIEKEDTEIVHNDNKMEPCLFESTSRIHPDVRDKYKGEFFKRLQFNGLTLTICDGDNIISLLNGDILKIYAFQKEPSSIKIIGRQMTVVRSFLTYPTDSSLLSIFVVKESDNDFIVNNLNEIGRKGLVLPYDGDFIYMPLQHT